MASAEALSIERYQFGGKGFLVDYQGTQKVVRLGSFQIAQYCTRGRPSKLPL